MPWHDAGRLSQEIQHDRVSEANRITLSTFDVTHNEQSLSLCRALLLPLNFSGRHLCALSNAIAMIFRGVGAVDPFQISLGEGIGPSRLKIDVTRNWTTTSARSGMLLSFGLCVP